MKIKKSLSSVERLNRIVDLVESSKRVSVEQICQEFDVSLATARRDLKLLHGQGSVKRVHGGAVALKSKLPESPVFQRMIIQSDSKQRIGVSAASVVEPGDTLFLGSGTTVVQVAKNIKNISDLTVITNSLLVINELLDCRNITLVDLGGVVRHSEYSLIGNITEAALSGLFADKVIIGIQGIDLDQGLTNHYLPETMTDRKITQMSKNIIVVADRTKCGNIATSQVAPISVVSTLVTDNETPKDFVQELRNMGITVMQV
jgi:DeoR family transcriptional regulator, aga operon transcriptional repressor